MSTYGSPGPVNPVASGSGPYPPAGLPGGQMPPVPPATAADPWQDETVVQPGSAPPAPQYAPPPQPPPYSPTPDYYAAPVPQSPAPAYQPGYAQPQPQGGYQQQQGYPPPATPQYQPAAYQAPGGYQGGYDQGGGYDQQQWQAPPKKKRSAAVIILSILLVLVVLAGAAVGIYLWQTRDTVTVPPPAAPAVGQCLASDGAATNPKLVVTACGSNTLQVVKVFHGTTDVTVCNGVKGVTTNYNFAWPVDPQINDYVLCLKQQ